MQRTVSFRQRVLAENGDRAADRLQAFQLLTAALRGDYGLDLIDDDHDLDPIRTQPEFRRLVQAARALRPAGTERTPRP